MRETDLRVARQDVGGMLQRRNVVGALGGKRGIANGIPEGVVELGLGGGSVASRVCVLKYLNVLLCDVFLARRLGRRRGEQLARRIGRRQCLQGGWVGDLDGGAALGLARQDVFLCIQLSDLDAGIGLALDCVVDARVVLCDLAASVVADIGECGALLG